MARLFAPGSRVSLTSIGLQFGVGGHFGFPQDLFAQRQIEPVRLEICGNVVLLARAM